MTWLAVWRSLGEVAATGAPVLAGYLLGRYGQRRRVDRVEADAWSDGFYEGLLTAAGPDHAGLDEICRRLDAQAEQTRPPHPHNPG